MMLSDACVSDLAFDEWDAGELDAETRARLENHLATCAWCATRRGALKRARQAFLAVAPTFDAQQTLRSGAAGTRNRRGTWAVTMLVSAALALLVVLPSRDRPATHSKGGAHVGFFVKHGASVSRGASGDAVQPGDLLRFTYSSPRERYLALLNLDAHAASIYYPNTPMAARVRAGSDVALDFSVELDAELGLEHVYAIFCDRPFALEPLRSELASARGLQPPADCEFELIALEKEPRR